MQKLWIAGHQVSTDDGFDVLNPYNGHVIDRVARGRKTHIEQAVEAALEGAKQMRDMPLYRRAAILNEVARLIELEREALAYLLAQEVGKTIREARLEVVRTAGIFRLAAEECKHLHGEQVPFEAVPTGAVRFGFWVREPVGIVGAITPFNVPLALSAHKVAPALATGNAVILKPAEQSPLANLHLVQLLYRAGTPPEALSAITGYGEEAGLPLVQHPRVRYISFTGSRSVGLTLPQFAGTKKLTLELGGNGAVIVAPSANVEAAAHAIVRGGYLLAGQLCISVQRVYVHHSLKKSLQETLLPLIEAIRMGDPTDDTTDMGPLIDYPALQRVDQWVQEAVAGGAKVLVGGKASPPFYEPTLLTNVPSESKLCCEEAFGPVVVLDTYDGIDEAIRKVNSTPYGLHMGIFTNDLQEAFHAAREIEAGGVMINDAPTFRSDLMPYGGMKESGLAREGIRWAMEHMTDPKVVCFNGIRLG